MKRQFMTCFSGAFSNTMRARTTRQALKKFALLLGLIALPLLTRGGTTIDSSHQYSYGANIGWLNWLADSSADGVVTGEFVCSGWIYAANVGWINMGSGAPANNIQYQNNSATDFGVNYSVDPSQPGIGILRGYAYGANIGWINFEATGNARISLLTGALSGYAYSANCGWINLNDMNGNYVQTDHIQVGVDTNGNGIADAWEYFYFGALLTPGQENSDPNGTGNTLLQDYLDGVNPTVANSGLRITAYSTNPGGTNSSVTWTSTVSRLYTIETSLDLATWTTDTTFAYPIAPDADPSTTRALTATNATKRFYRVKTMRPLP
jgi:hypothetical protein